MSLSTRNHALLDFATAGFLFAFPRLLGASPRLTRIATALACGKLAYSLLTRHEGGVVRVIPMKTHLALDVASGAALAGLPLMLKDGEKPAVTACTMAAGALDILAATQTETTSLPPGIPGYTTGKTTALPGERRLPEAGVVDSLKVILGVAAPTLAMGPILRRRPIMVLAEKLGFATGAVKTLQTLRDKYGKGPLMIKMMPPRNQAVLFDPDHVRRVLDESPEPFATATTEKRAALAHFEPKNALVSHGPERTERRRVNEAALQTSNAVHSLAERFLAVIDEEAASLLRMAGPRGELHWDEFLDAWFSMVRRVVFGDTAREDRRLTDVMAKLRSDANWLALKPIRTDLRDELHQGIGEYLRRAEPESLAAAMAATARTPMSAPENQIPQWLFAFDAAAMATYRALALLAAHRQHGDRALEEAGDGIAAARPHRPFLRATLLESVRLWPTTPAILRQTTRPTEWENGIMPAHTDILIYAPFFHRDETRLPFAHAFAPEVWLEDDPEVKGNPPRRWPLVPFSAGPGACPGRNVVLLLGSGMLAALLGKCSLQLKQPHRLAPGNLPGTLNPFTLRFAIGHAAGQAGSEQKQTARR